MSVLLNKNTKVLVQGITGRIGNFHAEEMIAYGTNVVAGVTPGKGGTTHLNKPVFNTVKEAVDATGAEATIVFVPAAAAADGIICLLYTSPSPRDRSLSRMPSSA